MCFRYKIEVSVVILNSKFNMGVLDILPSKHHYHRSMQLPTPKYAYLCTCIFRCVHIMGTHIHIHSHDFASTCFRRRQRAHTHIGVRAVSTAPRCNCGGFKKRRLESQAIDRIFWSLCPHHPVPSRLLASEKCEDMYDGRWREWCTEFDKTKNDAMLLRN